MKKTVFAICSTIVTKRMYLAWNKANEDYVTGECYFWTTFDVFKKLANDMNCNNKEHPITFESISDARNFIIKYNKEYMEHVQNFKYSVEFDYYNREPFDLNDLSFIEVEI